MPRDISRKEFLSFSALLAGGAVLPRTVAANGGPDDSTVFSPQQKGGGVVADVVVVNARVLTSDPALPTFRGCSREWEAPSPAAWTPIAKPA